MRHEDRVVTDNHAAPAIIRRNVTEKPNVERLADHAPEFPDTL